MKTVIFKENPLITSLELLGNVVEHKGYNPTTVYFDSLRGTKNKVIKGNSIYYYFEPNKLYVTENYIKGILVYQNKDLEITLVYELDENNVAEIIEKYFEKIDIDMWKIDHYEYIDSSRLVFRLNESKWIELKLLENDLVKI